MPPAITRPPAAASGPTRRGFLGTLLALLTGAPLLGRATPIAPPPSPPTATPVAPTDAVAPTPASLTPRLLNKVYVAGWQYHAGPTLTDPPPRPGEPVTLHAEPENPHDPFAVRLELRGKKIGYIPRTENHHLSRLLRDSAPGGLSAHVLAATSPDPAAPPWRAVRVAVCLHC